MQLEMNNMELEVVAKALKEYAGHAKEAARYNDISLVQLEFIGRCLCSKIIKAVEVNAIQDLFENARHEYCGMANDVELATCCIIGGMDDAGLDIATGTVIKDKKQRQDFKSNYKKMVQTVKRNMEQSK